ncbi:MAG: DoxX family protein [Acidimicrobiales bacterium]
MRFRTRTSIITDAALLGLRGIVGGYVAAHGAQKMFGVLNGPGLDRAEQHFEEDLDLAPGRERAAAAAGSELVGGTLTAAGLGGPLGPMAIIGTMTVASQTAHRGKGPFVADGGPELTLTNVAAAATIALVGPGRFSLDRVLRVRPSKLLIALAAWAGVGASVGVIQGQVVRRAEQQSRPAPAASRVEPEYVDLLRSA